MLSDEIHYSDERYTACPVIRYIPEDDYYYMICLEELPLRRFESYIYRTKDFITWEIGYHNPIFWTSPEDRNVMDGVSLPPDVIKEIETQLNINNSDVDLCEFEGKTYIVYCTGDQMSMGGYVCMAVYDGLMKEFFENFFNVL